MMMAKVSATVMSGKYLDTQLCIQHIFRFIDLLWCKRHKEVRIKLPAFKKKILAASMTIAERTGGNFSQPKPHCDLS